MKPIANFRINPAQLYFTVPDHVRSAFRNDIPSLPPNSSAFKHIYQEAETQLRELIGIPESWHLVFLSSAEELSSAILSSLRIQSVGTIGTSESTQRFERAALARTIGVTRIDPTSSPVGEMSILALTMDDATTGTRLISSSLSAIKSNYPNAWVVMDLSASVPYASTDFDLVDLIYAEAHYSLGLPAGLCFCAFSDRLLNSSIEYLYQKPETNLYFSLPRLHEMATQSLPVVPNGLGLHLLGKVSVDLLSRGILTLKRETDYKAAILQNLLRNHKTVHSTVPDPAVQSKTTLPVLTTSRSEVIAHLEAKGLLPDQTQDNLLTFANYPTHSKEQYELLVDTLDAFEG